MLLFITTIAFVSKFCFFNHIFHCKTLTGKKRANKPSSSIRDKNGKLLHDKDKILDRWKEYDDNRPERCL